MRSMTGFGAARVTTDQGVIHVEGRSRNARGLELHAHLPPLLRHVEPVVLDLVRRRVLRGRVDVHVRWERTASETLPETEGRVVDAQMAWMRAVMFRAGIPAQPTLDTLLNAGLLERLERATPGEPRSVDAAVAQAVEQMVTDLVAFRCTEGEKLAAFLVQSLQELRRLVARMEEETAAQATDVEARWRDRIERLRQAMGADAPEASRLLSEVVLLMQKTDVAEELCRLKAHLGALGDALARGARGEAQGTRLGVLLQECVRELSTVAAKGHRATLTHLSVDARVLVERMREQTLNLE